MAHVCSKRSRADGEDRREFGQLKKKARTNSDASKVLLGTERGQTVLELAQRFDNYIASQNSPRPYFKTECQTAPVLAHPWRSAIPSPVEIRRSHTSRL